MSPVLSPTLEDCDTTTFLGWQGPSGMCPGHCSRAGRLAQPPKTQTRLCQAGFWSLSIVTCVGRLLLTHKSAVFHNPKQPPRMILSCGRGDQSVHLRPTGFIRERGGTKTLPSGPGQPCWDFLWSQEAPPTLRFCYVLPLKEQRKGNSCKNLLFKAPEASEPTVKCLVWDSFLFFF